MPTGTDIGYYTLPVILSFQGVDQQVNSKFKAAFGDIGKKSSADFGKGFGDGLKATEAQITRFKDKAADALGKVRVAEVALTKARESGNSARIVAAEERLATARRNSTRLTKEATDAVEKFDRANDGLDRGVGKSSKSLGAFSNVLSGISGKLGGTSGKFAEFGSRAAGGLSAIETGGSKAATAVVGIGVAASAAVVGVAALAAVAVVATKAFYDLGAQFDEISDNFVIKLGATGDKLEALNDRVKRLGPTTASSLGEIGNVTAEVGRHLEGTTTQLDQVTKTIADLNRMTGQTTDVKKFGQLLAQWKIPAQDQVKTLDMLNNVSRKTGLSVNEVMEILTGKGAAALRELTIPMEQAVGLMSVFQDAGLDAAASVEMLAKAQKYAKIEGLPLNDVLDQLFAMIRNNDPEAGALAYKVLGKNAAALIEAVKDGRITIKQFHEAIAAGGPTIAETAAATDDWAEKWQKLKNLLSVALEPAGTAVFDTINEKLTEFSDWVVNNQDKVVTFLGDVAVGFIEAGEKALTFGQGVLEVFRGIIQMYNKVPAILGGPDQDIDTKFIDESIASLEAGKKKLGEWKPKVREFADELANATKLTQALGTDVSAFATEAGEIELLGAPSEDTKRKLEEHHIQIKEIKDDAGKPVKWTVTASTAEGQKIIDDWKSKNKKKPVETETTTDTGPAEESVSEFDAEAKAKIETDKKINVDTANANAKLDEMFKKYHLGGIAVPLGDPSIITVDVITANAETGMDEFLKKYPMLDPNAPSTQINPDVPVLDFPAPGGGGPDASTGQPGPFQFKGLKTNALRIGSQIHSAFPDMAIGGVRADPYPDHPSGKAIDVMVGDSPGGKALGDRLFARYIRDPGTNYILWQQTENHPDGRKIPMGPRGSRTADHYDHLHIMTKKLGGGIPGFGGGDRIPALLEGGEHIFDKDDVKAMGGHAEVYAFRKMLHEGFMKPLGFGTGGRVPDWDAIANKESGGDWSIDHGDADSTGGLQIQKRTWDNFGGPALTGHEWPYQATKEQQIMIAEKILAAQGPNAWAGGKNFVWKDAPTTTTTGSGGGAGGGYTAGTGPGGESGYYSPPDPDVVQSAKEDLDAAIVKRKAAEERQKAADANTEATEQDKASAKADADNAKAAEASAQAKLDAAKKGEFTAGDMPTTPFPGYRNVPATQEEIAGAVEDRTQAEGKLAEAIAARKDMDKKGPLGEDTSSDEARAKQDQKIADLQEEVRLAKEHETAVRRGTNEPGKESDSGDEKKVEHDAQLNQLGQLPGMMVNGLLETLGIGDIFPDLTQTPMWKSFAGGLSAFKGPIQGLVEGKLGVQQPGWSPGQPIPGSGDTGAGGTSGGIPMPFGLPDVSLPGPTDVHGAGGPPGPPVLPGAQDNSVNITYNGNVGHDPEEVRRQNERMIRTQNMPVGN